MSSLANVNAELGPLAKNIEPVVKMLESMTKSTMKSHKAMGHLINNNKKMLQALQKGVVAQKAQTKAVDEADEATKEINKSLGHSITSFYSLAEAQEAVNKTNVGLARNFAEAANGTGKFSKAWTMFSRVLSGSSLWRLQNYLRSVGQAMDFFYSRTENATKAANEQAQEMGKLTVNIQQVKEQLELMGKVGSHKELIESNLEYKNTFEALVAAGEEEQRARELALARTQNMYNATLSNLEDNLKKEGKALQKALAHEERMRNKSFLKRTKLNRDDLVAYEKLVDKKTKAEERFKKAKEEYETMKKTSILKDDKIGPLSELKKELNRARKEKMVTSRRLKKSGADADTMAQLKTALEQQDNEAKERHEKRIAALKLIGKSTERFMTFGLGFKNIGKGLKAGFKDMGKDPNTNKRFQGLRNQLKKGQAYVKRQGGYRAVFMKMVTPIFSVIGKVMKMAVAYSFYFIMFLVGALVVFMVIKKIFEKAEVMSVLLETLKGVFDGIKTMFGGAILIFEAFFGGGTLKERFTKLFQGILGLYKGLGKIIFSVLVGAVKLVINLAVAYITFVIDTYWALVRTIFSKAFWTKTVAGALIKIKDFFVELPFKIKDKIVEVYEKLKTYIGKKISDILDALNPFHMGGTTTGGMAMVGERGPELVKLPAGSRVHSNDTTKSMLKGSVTNNISVNVNGRLGASDTELRDIAKKIGRMVSTEINRTTSSSTNVRF